MSVPSILLANDAAYGVLHVLRHYFLLGAKWGNDTGCEALQEKVDALKQKMGIAIPIKAAVNSIASWSAHGAVVYGRGAVTVPESEVTLNKKLSDDTQIALLAHELSHIKCNDGPWLFLTTVVTFTVSTFFLWQVLPAATSQYTVLLALIPTISELFRQMVLQEWQADIEACKHLNEDQKEAYLNWLEKEQREAKNNRNDPTVFLITQIWRKIWYDKEGNHIFRKWTHLTWRERIFYIRSQIQPRIEKAKPSTTRTYLTKSPHDLFALFYSKSRDRP